MPLDALLVPSNQRLLALSSYRRGLVLAACADRLVPLYEHFADTTRWGSAEPLRVALDRIWATTEEQPALADVPRLLANIEFVTPHGDDFPTLEGLWAQDACILVDSAVRCVAGLAGGDQALWFNFEALQATISHELAGALSADAALEEQICADDRIGREIRLVDALCELVATSGTPAMQTRAQADRWSPTSIRTRPS